ncbi:hypothetical protein EDD18DRAFT_1194924, partial [Armillaria luteobubalina]
MPNFAHDDDYEFVQDFRDSRDDVTPLECAPLFSLTTATLAVCPRKLSSSQSIRIRFSASTTDARYRETSSARHTAILRDVHDVHDDDFRGIATDLNAVYEPHSVWATAHFCEYRTEFSLRQRQGVEEARPCGGIRPQHEPAKDHSTSVWWRSWTAASREGSNTKGVERVRP